MVVLVDVEARFRVVVGDEVGVTSLDAVVQDGDGDALAGEPGQPGLLHVHVQPVAAVEVPHLGPSEKRKGIS